MPSADHDPDLQRRLTLALDRVQPAHSTPRYLSIRPRSFAWRLLPAAIAAAALGVLVASAYASTGSTNPADWTKTVVNAVAPPPPTTTETERSTAPEHESEPQPQPQPVQHETPEPSESPEPKASESPESNDSNDGSSDSGGSER